MYGVIEFILVRWYGAHLVLVDDGSLLSVGSR